MMFISNEQCARARKQTGCLQTDLRSHTEREPKENEI